MSIAVYKTVSNFEIERVVLVHPSKMYPEIGDYVRYDDYKNLQAENERLKKELADSLPLRKIREMVEYCKIDGKGFCVECKYDNLCGTWFPTERELKLIEQYAKRARNEL